MIWICVVVPHSCLRFTIFVEDDVRGVCFHCVTSACHIVLNSVVSLRWCLLDLSIVKAPLLLCSFVIICRMIIWDWDPHPPFRSIHGDPCPSQLLWISGRRMVMSWRFSVKVPSLPVSRGHHCTVYNALPSFLFWCSNDLRIREWNPIHAGSCVLLNMSPSVIWHFLAFW